MADTKIEWATKVWNPTRGCSRVSAGCDHCYAMREARRHDHAGGAYEGLTRIGPRGVDWKGVVRLVPEMLDLPSRWRKPQRVFVNSMSDLFHESLSDLGINRVFGEMARSPQHTFLVLTKRPRRALSFFEWARVANATVERWPLRNVWLGVSVEDQATADERIPLLLETPASVRFVSYEPALGPVDFAPWVKFARFEEQYRKLAANAGGESGLPQHLRWNGVKPPALDWVIVGGESGPGARPFAVAWARSTVEQCRDAGVAAFVKQVGAHVLDHDAPWVGPGCPWPGGSRWNADRVLLRDRKGGDMSEWPADLRVREFPAVRA